MWNLTPTVVLILLLPATRLMADGIPSDITRGLKANADLLTPVEVTWTFEVKALVDESILTSQYGETNLKRFRNVSKTTALLEGCKISQITRLPRASENGGVKFQTLEKTFDEEYWYCGTGIEDVTATGSSPVLTIERLANVRETLSGKLFRLDYFELAGFFVAQTAAELGSNPSSIVLHAQSPTQTIACVPDLLDGEQCHKVTSADSAGSTTWWLSQSKNYAVLRTEHLNADGKLLSRTESSEFVELGDRNIWLPKHIDKFWYTWGEKRFVSETPVVAEEFRVTLVSHAAMSADRFVLKYDTPGTFVSDAKLADEMKSSQDHVDYQVPAKQADLDRVIEQAALGKDYRPPRPGLPRSLLVVNGVVLAIVVTWLILRRYRKGHR